MNVLSAGIPLAGLWLVCPLLAIGTKLPSNGDNAKDDGASNQSVAPPVGRLSVPTTSRRPDVLGVAVISCLVSSVLDF